MSHPKFELKSISEGAIPAALDKAERYRLLNDPEQAESICRDVLRVDGDNQAAIRCLVLSLTDLFASGNHHGSAREARSLIGQLADEYERAYMLGLVAEREARALLARHGVQSAAYHGLREAMERYEEAEALRASGNDEALLRWNSCARTIAQHRLEPEADERELPLE
jgi:hypothetical protein